MRERERVGIEERERERECIEERGENCADNMS